MFGQHQHVGYQQKEYPTSLRNRYGQVHELVTVTVVTAAKSASLVSTLLKII